MANFLNNILFIFQRLNWLSVLDILLVTLIFFVLLYSLRDTQAMVLLRGMIFLVVALVLLTTLVELPAFSWLIRSILPALLLAIPVIFAPEIRRALERLGRAGTLTIVQSSDQATNEGTQKVIRAVVEAAARLSARQHGALIVVQRMDSLEQYIDTGVQMRAHVTPNCFCKSSTRIHHCMMVPSLSRRDASLQRRVSCHSLRAAFSTVPRNGKWDFVIVLLWVYQRSVTRYQWSFQNRAVLFPLLMRAG